MNELALFAGAGGGILGGHLLGWRTRCAVEVAPYPRRVLLARQRDGILPRFPVWDDVCTFDGKPWKGHIDVVSGGFPCTDISASGTGKGIEGEKSGLWKEMARILGEVGSPYCFLENSPILTSRGLGVVLGDLASMGYSGRWGVLGAHHAGAPHRRDRIWLVGYSHANHLAYTNNLQGSERGQREVDAGFDRQREDDTGRSTGDDRSRSFQKAVENTGAEDSTNACSDGLEGLKQTRTTARPTDGPGDGCNPGWWEVEPNVGRVAYGVASWIHRLRATGNGQVPRVAAEAFRILSKEWR